MGLERPPVVSLNHRLQASSASGAKHLGKPAKRTRKPSRNSAKLSRISVGFPVPSVPQSFPDGPEREGQADVDGFEQLLVLVIHAVADAGVQADHRVLDLVPFLDAEDDLGGGWGWGRQVPVLVSPWEAGLKMGRLPRPAFSNSQ